MKIKVRSRLDGSCLVIGKSVIAAVLMATSVCSALALVKRKGQEGETKSEMAAATFPSLVREYIDDLHSRHPSLALSSGVHAWDDKLEDFSPLAIAEEVAAIRHFQSKIAKIPRLELGLSDLFDYQIISSNVSSRLLELEQIKAFERNPAMYTEVLSTALLPLVIFEYAPAEVRLKHLISKEKQIPRFLEDARANVHRPDATLLRVAIENNRGMLSFIQKELPTAFKSVANPALKKDFSKSTRVASEAIEKHIKLLEQIKPDPTPSFAIGLHNYEARLRYEEGIDMPVSALLKIADRELAKTQTEFRHTAALIDPNKSAATVWAEVQKEHPSPGTLVREARNRLERLRQFIQDKHIVGLPRDVHVEVSQSPDFMRWSTASMWTPGPFETRPLPSRYMITDVDPSWTDKQKQEYLASVNDAQLWTTSIHEAYPGHFVQGEYLNRVESVVRRTVAFLPGSFVEGWAHYTEQMMLDEGFGDGDPKLRLGQLADALLRLCRFECGIRLHTAGMTVQQATRFFIDNGYMGETPAKIEASRGTFDPLYLVYSVGKLAILKMRSDYQHYQGDNFSLEDFHNRLLSNGYAPLWIQRQMLMPGDKGKLLE